MNIGNKAYPSDKIFSKVKVLQATYNIKLPLVSSVRVHNNCELPVGIYNICECLVWVGCRCSASCGVDIFD